MGTERRIHRVFITRNTEYHVRRDVCVAVRDRRSGSWLRAHQALRGELSGGIRFNGSGGVIPNPQVPRIGESLYFQSGGRDLVTSTVLAVERPPKAVVVAYPR